MRWFLAAANGAWPAHNSNSQKCMPPSPTYPRFGNGLRVVPVGDDEPARRPSPKAQSAYQRVSFRLDAVSTAEVRRFAQSGSRRR